MANETLMCPGSYAGDLWWIMLHILYVVVVYLSGAEVEGLVKLFASVSRERQLRLVSVTSVQSPLPPHKRTPADRAKTGPPTTARLKRERRFVRKSILAHESARFG
ncbi:hypothetical protein DPMN_109577 [Dreissena polymorpha]|uniref:Uncharacterized protein n=1 Tax=Dreissena polymorpha TaxID=45954 RepID=A0A9D4QN25_DREPO|nr:hypothetical protein DPMN_109577 [Dreissena polymorpha]